MLLGVRVHKRVVQKRLNFAQDRLTAHSAGAVTVLAAPVSVVEYGLAGAADLAGEGYEVVTHREGALAELLDAGGVVRLPLGVHRAELGLGELGGLRVLDVALGVLGRGADVAAGAGHLAGVGGVAVRRRDTARTRRPAGGAARGSGGGEVMTGVPLIGSKLRTPFRRAAVDGGCRRIRTEECTYPQVGRVAARNLLPKYAAAGTTTSSVRSIFDGHPEVVELLARQGLAEPLPTLIVAEDVLDRPRRARGAAPRPCRFDPRPARRPPAACRRGTGSVAAGASPHRQRARRPAASSGRRRPPRRHRPHRRPRPRRSSPTRRRDGRTASLAPGARVGLDDQVRALRQLGADRAQLRA